MSHKKLAKNILVTGANRGLGLQLVNELLPQVDHVFATCRQPNIAKELSEIEKSHENLTVLKLDVTSQSDITSCMEEVTRIVGASGLSCLFNNAGIFIDKPVTTVLDLTEEHLSETFKVNVIAPVMITKAFLPLLKQAAVNPVTDYFISKAVIANISSSFGTNAAITKQTPRYYAYRSSKISLINFTKILSYEVEDAGIFAFSLHPGWVKTDMGGPMGALTTEESAVGMIKVLSSLQESYRGKCVNWEGQILED